MQVLVSLVRKTGQVSRPERISDAREDVVSFLPYNGGSWKSRCNRNLWEANIRFPLEWKLAMGVAILRVNHLP